MPLTKAAIDHHLQLNGRYPLDCCLILTRGPRSASAELFELAIRQVSKCSSRSGGGFVETTNGRTWPGAVIQLGAANGRTWQETCRSGEKLDSGSRTTALAPRNQPAKGSFHFSPLTAKGTEGTVLSSDSSPESGQ